MSVAELSRIFDVTEETVRRDLKHLESDGLLRRTHGGALKMRDASGRRAAPVNERVTVNQEMKQHIGKIAASLVADGDTILLDSGSTTLELAKALTKRRNLVIVTHSLCIAAQFAEAPHVSINVLGGNMRPTERVLVGPDTITALTRMHVDKAFMACTGCSLEHGVTVSDILEAEVKRAMVAMARDTILLADHTKWNKASLIPYAGILEFNALISDADFPEPARDALRHSGVDVLLSRRRLQP